MKPRCAVCGKEIPVDEHYFLIKSSSICRACKEKMANEIRSYIPDVHRSRVNPAKGDKVDAKRYIYPRIQGTVGDCKYPDQVHELYLKDKIEDDECDYLIEHYCEKCPIVRML